MPSAHRVTEQGPQAETFEARYYRVFIYIVMVILLVWIGGWAVLDYLDGQRLLSITLLLGLAFTYALGLYFHYRAPYRITITAEGFTADTILGTTWKVGWNRVQRIQLL